MCGICVLLLSNDGDTAEDNYYKFDCHLKNSRLMCRGPDIQNTVGKVLTPSCYGVFYGSTLHFRGELTPQPLQDKHGNILLWNGEVFGGIEVLPDENDGEVLLTLLGKCKNDEDLLQLFSKIQGPWAFVYWKALTNQLWFGRDIFGRRSLLLHKEADKCFALASIAIKEWTPWQEVPALGIYCVPTDHYFGDCAAKPIVLYPWASLSKLPTEGGTSITANCQIWNKSLLEQSSSFLDDFDVEVSSTLLLHQIMPFNNRTPDLEADLKIDLSASVNLDKLASDHLRELADKLTCLLQEAVRIRTSYQSDKCSRCIQKDISSLSNADSRKYSSLGSQTRVSSETVQMCDPESGHCSHSASDKQYHVQCQCVKMNSLTFCDDKTQPTGSSSPSGLDNTVPDTYNEKLGAVMHGTLSHCVHARVAVLFSGGIDSLFIAALADRCVPDNEPIDLLNVAFEQRVATEACQTGSQAGHYERQQFAVPDRKTGLAGVKELSSLNPNRMWNFVEIDVTLKELQKLRAEHVKSLVYPLCTVLDDSIGCAIWCASRGQGVIRHISGEVIPYESPARVVLVGMGADEQLVGYSRHRAKYMSCGWCGLVGEIRMEIERISARNLGRDDRVISDNGREARFPFLDENVVSFLNQLPLHEKANLNLPRGIGEKFLLRLASERLGLKEGATLPKRAIQFGSKIAKAENRKEKGSDNCYRLQD